MPIKTESEGEEPRMKSYKELVEDILLNRLDQLAEGNIESAVEELSLTLQSHSTSLVRQLLESVEEKGTSSTCKRCDGDGCSRCFSEDGWNSCRETLIQKATQMGIEV